MLWYFYFFFIQSFLDTHRGKSGTGKTVNTKSVIQYFAILAALGEAPTKKGVRHKLSRFPSNHLPLLFQAAFLFFNLSSWQVFVISFWSRSSSRCPAQFYKLLLCIVTKLTVLDIQTEVWLSLLFAYIFCLIFPNVFMGWTCVFCSLTPSSPAFFFLVLEVFLWNKSWLTFKLSFFLFQAGPTSLSFLILSSFIHRICFFSDYNRMWLLNRLMYLKWANKIVPHFLFLFHVCLWSSIFSSNTSYFLIYILSLLMTDCWLA